VAAVAFQTGSAIEVEDHDPALGQQRRRDLLSQAREAEGFSLKRHAKRGGC